jgi:hypothetical protein
MTQIGLIPNEDKISLISATEEDNSRDKDFEVRDLSESSSSTGSEKTIISDDEITCLQNLNITGDQSKASQPLSEQIKVSVFLKTSPFFMFTKFCIAGKKSS